MKQLFFVGLLLCVLFACSKHEPIPDAGTMLSGNYAVSMYTYDSSGVIQSTPLPITAGGITQASATVTATYLSATSINLILKLSQINTEDIEQDLGKVDLVVNAQSYDLYSGSLKIGNSDGQSMNLDLPLTDPATSPYIHIQITAQKE
jgi:hypothetical protein